MKKSESLTFKVNGLTIVSDPKISKKYRLSSEEPLRFMLNESTAMFNTDLFSYPITVRCYDGFIMINDDSYDGFFTIQKHNNELLLINSVNLESYIYSVVFHEIGTLGGEEGAKAQAICARSYTYSTIYYDRTKLPYDFYTDERSQMYKGINKIPEHIRRAVNKTTGIILLEGNDIVYSFYASTCGGYTQSASNLFKIQKTMKSLSGVKCEYCKNSPHYYWNVKIDKSTIVEKVGDFDEIILNRFNPNTNHIKEIVFKNGSSSKKLDLYKEFRSLIGKNIIKSPLISDVKIIGESVFFTGNGLGHCIGLCQWGAIEMSSHGYNYEQILMTYFPNSKLEKIY